MMTMTMVEMTTNALAKAYTMCPKNVHRQDTLAHTNIGIKPLREKAMCQLNCKSEPKTFNRIQIIPCERKASVFILCVLMCVFSSFILSLILLNNALNICTINVYASDMKKP